MPVREGQAEDSPQNPGEVCTRAPLWETSPAFFSGSFAVPRR